MGLSFGWQVGLEPTTFRTTSQFPIIDLYRCYTISYLMSALYFCGNGAEKHILFPKGC